MAEKTIGRYRIESELGRGAMGLVYKAYDPVLERHAAIKVMTTSGEMDDELRARFFREARSAARLSNPNIISIYDMGDDQNRPFIAMEFVQGEDLKAVIRRRVFFPFARKLDLIAQICRALHYAHKNGVIHRDVKPGNVRLTPEGQVKILDFGLARLGSSEMTRTGTLMGTPYYMSPEQAKGAREIDGRSDLFSVGVILYEFLCYRRPFEADSPTAVCYQIIAEPHAPLSIHLPGCDKEIEAILDRSLAKDPANRFTNGEEMANALSAFALRLAEKEQALSVRVEEIESELERYRAEAQRIPLQPLLDPALLDDTLFPIPSDVDEHVPVPELEAADHDYGYLLHRHAHLEKALQSMVRDLEKVGPLIEAFERCKRQFESEQWEDCLANAQEILKSCPRNPDLLNLERQCLERIEARRQEQERREKAKQAIARLIQQAEERQKHQDLEGTLAAAEEALQLDPGNSEAVALKQSAEAGLELRRKAAELLAQARAKEAEKDFDSAHRIAAEGLRFAPGNKDLERVQENAKRVLERQAQLANVLENARALLEAEDFEGAQKAVREALSIEPKSRAGAQIREQVEAGITRQKQAAALLAKAEEAEAGGDFAACLAAAEEGLAVDSRSSRLHELAARAAELVRKRKQADQFLEEARQALIQGDYRQAGRKTEEALGLQPGLAEAVELQTEIAEAARRQEARGLLSQAEACCSKGDFGECRRRIDSGLALVPEDEELKALRQKLDTLESLIRQASDSLQRGEYEKALEVAGNALEVDAGQSAANQIRKSAAEMLERKKQLQQMRVDAESLLGRGSYESCLKVCREALKLGGENTAFRQLAKQAENELDRSRRVDQLLNQARERLGARNYQEAMELAQAVLDLSPENRSESQGAVRGRKEAEETRRQAEEGLKSQKRLKELITTGRHFIKAKRWKECLELVAEGFRLEPKNPELVELQKEASASLDQQRKAEKLAGEAGRLLRAGDYPGALGSAEKALALDPAHPDAAKTAALAKSEIQRGQKIHEIVARARGACESNDYESGRALALEGLGLDHGHQELGQLLAAAERGLTERKARLDRLRVAGRDAQRAKDFDSCLTLAAQGLALDPHDAELLKLQAWAEDLLAKQRAEQERQDKVAELLSAGRAELSRKRLRRARSLYGELLQLEPDHPDALAAKVEIASGLSTQRRRATRVASLVTTGLLVVLAIIWLVRNPDVIRVRSDAPAQPPAIVQKAPDPPPPSPEPEPLKPQEPAAASSQDVIQQKLDQATTSLEAKDFAGAATLAGEVLRLSEKHSKALQIQRESRQQLSEIARSKRRIKDLLSEGKYGEAQAALNSVQTLSGRDNEIQDLSEQLKTRSRRAADSASAEAQGSRERAEKAAVDAGVSVAPARSLNTQAQALYQSGDYPGAAATFSKARDAYVEIEKKAAQVLKGRQLEGQRRSAVDARQSFDRRRAAAQQAGAESLAAALFARAGTAGSNAENKLQQGDFTGAEKGYQEAETLMQQASEAARKAAESARAARQTENETSSRERQQAMDSQRRLAAARQGFTGEDAEASAEEARAQQHLKEGRWADAITAFDRAIRRYESGKAETAALDRIIGSYASAFSGKDLRTLQALWPGMDQSNLESFRSTFDINESIQLRLTPVRFSFRDQKAVVICTADLSYTPKRDRRELSLSSDSATFTMTRAGSSWTIESFVGNYRGK